MYYVSPMQYTGKRCACFKNNDLCNSRCHNSVNCLNKEVCVMCLQCIILVNLLLHVFDYSFLL
jgi:hypothetical protein